MTAGQSRPLALLGNKQNVGLHTHWVLVPDVPACAGQPPPFGRLKADPVAVDRGRAARATLVTHVDDHRGGWVVLREHGDQVARRDRLSLDYLVLTSQDDTSVLIVVLIAAVVVRGTPEPFVGARRGGCDQKKRATR